MPQRRPLRLITTDFSDTPSLDTAITRALLLRASNNEIPETIRLYCPGRVMAFGKRDTLEPGYRHAIAASLEAGFSPVERLAGGRAAVFSESTIAFAWTVHHTDPRRGIYDRFERLSALMVAAFGRLGVDSAIGEIPGEYCPGEYSVHHANRIKLMGVGQRLSRSAAHVGGVVVVSDPGPIRSVLISVYEALGLSWNPTTVGALSNVEPDVTWQQTVDAILGVLSIYADVEEGTIEQETLDLAASLQHEHLPASLR